MTLKNRRTQNRRQRQNKKRRTLRKNTRKNLKNKRQSRRRMKGGTCRGAAGGETCEFIDLGTGSSGAWVCSGCHRNCH